MHFDTRQFVLDKFKSAGGLVAFTRAYAIPKPPTEAAAIKWVERDSIPSAWFPVLLAYLELEEGSPISIKHYLRDTP